MIFDSGLVVRYMKRVNRGRESQRAVNIMFGTVYRLVDYGGFMLGAFTDLHDYLSRTAKNIFSR